MSITVAIIIKRKGKHKQSNLRVVSARRDRDGIKKEESYIITTFMLYNPVIQEG